MRGAAASSNSLDNILQAGLSHNTKSKRTIRCQRKLGHSTYMVAIPRSHLPKLGHDGINKRVPAAEEVQSNYERAQQ